MKAQKMSVLDPILAHFDQSQGKEDFFANPITLFGFWTSIAVQIFEKKASKWIPRKVGSRSMD